MSDLQAKYNALLRKFIGDSTFAIDGDTENELAKDIAAAMKEKAKRHEPMIKASQEAQRRSNEMLADILFPANFNEKFFNGMISTPEPKKWFKVEDEPVSGAVHINVTLDYVKQRDAQLGQELEDAKK